MQEFGDSWRYVTGAANNCDGLIDEVHQRADDFVKCMDRQQDCRVLLDVDGNWLEKI